jgi:hypothetical protein
MAERVIAAGGPGNLSPEERAALEKEGRELETKVFATSDKLSERLRQHLTPEQLAFEKELIASRPDFLPGLPGQMRRARRGGSAEGSRGGSFYIPGAGSWQPGMPMPVPTQEPQRRSRFPRSEEE